MPCTVIMDLKPKETKFTISTTEKSATILCTFTGRYLPAAKREANSVDIELMISNRSGNMPLKKFVSELEAVIASGKLLRVSGTLRRLAYQDRDTGLEIDRLSVYAFDVTPSNESEPILSTVQMEGGVRKVSDTDIFKDTGELRMVKFNLFCGPSSDYDKESYLTISVVGFNDTADWVERLRLKETSHVVAHGKLEASNFGPPLRMTLYDLSYATWADTGKEQ